MRFLFVATFLCCLAPLSWAGSGTWTTNYPFGANLGAGALAIDPANPGVLYAAPLWRGVYRSGDGGASWQPLLDDERVSFDNKHIPLVAVDTAGEVYIVAFDFTAGRQALLRSADGGASWGAADPGVAGDTTALAVAPSDVAVRYLGTQQGEVYASADGGLSWALAAAGLPGDEVRSLEVHPGDPATVYAGMAASGVYKSVDGGASWSDANGGSVIVTVGDLAIDPAAPLTVYAADDDPSTGKGVFKSTDGGASWTKLAPFFEFGGVAGRLLAIDPADPSRLFAVAGSEVLASSDSGASWAPALAAESQISSLQLDPAAPAVVWATSYGEGIFRSTDGGVTWAARHDGIRGRHFPHSRAKSLAFDASDPLRLYAGSINRGHRSADGGASWTSMAHPGGGMSTFASHPGAPGVVYGAANDLWRSTDSGLTWADWNNGAFCCFQEADVAIHPGDPSTLYLAGHGSCCAADGVYKSTDGGLTWALASAGLGNPRIHMLAVDPNDGDTLYAGTACCGGPSALYKTSDGAASWAQLGGGLPADFNANQVAIHPLDSNLLYMVAEASAGNGVWRSLDGGDTWTQLFVENGNSVVVDPTDTAKVYVATWNTTGFYRSLDGGATWALVNGGLPVQPGLEAIALDPTDLDRVLLATVGGVYEIDLGAGTLELLVTTLDDGGPGSLRHALTQAQQDGVANRIRFAPALAGGTIAVASELPHVSAPEPIDLDGDLGGDCVPDIGLDGSALAPGTGFGLVVGGVGNRVAGLAIHSYSNDGIIVFGDGNLIECNHLGTDLSGSADLGAGMPHGLKISAANGNTATANRIFFTGVGVGIAEGASDNVIGPGNEIAWSDGPGVRVTDGIDERFPDFAGLVGDPIQVFPLIDFSDDGGTAPFESADGITPIDSAGNTFHDAFGARFTGTLEIVLSTDYTFELEHDDSVRLLVDGGELVAAGCCGPSSAMTFLGAGSHSIEIDFREHPGGARLALSITGGGAVTLTTDGNLGGCPVGQNGLCGEFFQLRVPSDRNRISENAIHDNAGLAIDLGEDGGAFGVNANDPGDADIGPNTLIDFPVITQVTDNGGDSFTVDGTAPADATVELFAAKRDPSGFGEADIFVGAVLASPAGAFSHTFARPPDLFWVAATATDPAGNTSELSAAALLTPNRLTVTSAADAGAGSLREAIEQANADGAPTEIDLDPGLAGQTVFLLSELPPLHDDGTAIDADLGADCAPDLGLSGALIPPGQQLFAIRSDGNLVRGLALFSSPGHGVLLSTDEAGEGASGNVLECNWVGLDLAGGAAGNAGDGLQAVDGASGNRIGPGNRIADNGGNGISIRDGLDYRYPDFAGLSAEYVGVFPLIDLEDGCAAFMSVDGIVPLDASGATFTENVGGRFTGTLDLGAGGDYTFTCDSLDDECRVVIDGAVALQAFGGDPADPSPSVTVSLSAGGHDFEVDFLEGGGATTWRLQIAGPGSVALSTDGNAGGCAEGQSGLCGELFQLRIPAEGNTITENAIFDNGGLGIGFNCCCGPTQNDPGDADVGPNAVLNFPQLDTFDDLGGGTFDLGGTAPPDALVELFGAAPDPSGFGEGAEFLGAATADPGGAFAATVALPSDFYAVTATATDAAGNTSEFSPVLGVKSPDAITVGDAVGFQGEVVAVPVFVRDLAATALGVDQPAGSRIQAFTFQVAFTPAAGVLAASGGRAGLTAGLVPLFETSVVSGNTVTYVASFDEAASPIPLVLDAAAPGDQVAELLLTLSPTAPPSPIALQPVAAGTVLANQAGTVEESAPAGSLELFGGTLTVRTRAATALSARGLSSSSVGLSWSDPQADETGFRVERSPDGAGGWSVVATLGPDTTAFVDGGLAAATLYYYRVISFSGAGDNLPSNTAVAFTFPAAAANACVQPVTFLDHGWARLADVDRGPGGGWATVRQERDGGTDTQILFQFLDPAALPVGAALAITATDMMSQFPTVIWNGSRFGVFWGEHMRGPLGVENTGNNFFSLLDANGQILRSGVRLFDDPPLGGLNSDAEWSFAWDGGGWGHVAPDLLDDTTSDVFFWRFAEDGEPLAGPVNVSASAGDVEGDARLAWSGSEYGMVWIRQQGGVQELLFQRRNADGTAAAGDPPPVVLAAAAPGETLAYSDIVWNGAGWAVVWGVFLDDADGTTVVDIRLLAADGTPLGPAKRVSDAVDAQQAAQGQPGWPVYDELPKLLATTTGYLCFTSSWTGASFAYEVMAYELDAAGDRVEHAPGLARRAISELDGAHSIFERAAAAADLGSFAVTYNDGRQGTMEVASAAVAADGSVIGGPHDLSCCHSPGNPVLFTGASNGLVEPLLGGFVTLWTDQQSGVPQIYARLFDAGGAPGATLAPLSGRDVAGAPGMVSVGDTFAVAWKDGGGNVVFARYDALGGVLLGEVEVATGATGRAHLTMGFSGEAYGLLYQDADGLVLLRLDPAGVPLGPKTLISDQVWGWPPPLVEWAGAGWAVLWRGRDHDLHYALVDPFGTVVVADTVLTSSGRATQRFDLHWTGERLGLAWKEDRGVDPPGHETYFTILDLDGSFAIPEVEVVNPYFSGGAGPLLYWRGDRFGLVRPARTNVDGTWEDEILPDGTLLSEVRQLTNRSGPSAIAFDGAALALLWGQFRSELYFETDACLADATPPACPEVTLTAEGAGVRLAWTPVDDPESGIWRYDLYRDGVMLAELFPTTAGHIDGGARPGVVHGYQVRALNGAYLESAGCPVHVFSTVGGDGNGDGVLDVADVFYLINFFFAGGAPPVGDADANGDGAVTIADVFYLINFLFGGGPPPTGESGGRPPIPAGVAQDVLALGASAGAPGETVTVPLSVRDLAGTPLDEGSGPGGEIQGLALRIDYTPADAVAGIDFELAGVTAGKVPIFPVTSSGAGYFYALASFDEGRDPLAFTLDGAPPGDRVALLRVRLAAGAVPGSEVRLEIDPATAGLVNGAATVAETPAGGTLALVDGAIAVLAAGGEIFADGFESGDTSAWRFAVP